VKNGILLKVWAFHSFLLMMVLNFSIFFWDFFSGTDTQGFGVLEPYHGLPMFYVYMISYFSSLIVILAILKTEKFGIGFLVWVPYALIGFFVETYFELILNPVLINIWGVIGYCAFGLLTGLSADLSYKLLSQKTKIRKGYIAGLSGIIMSIAYFVGIIIALNFFYKAGNVVGDFNDPGSFLGVSYFGLPWMLINAFFGGFTAHALHHFVDNKKE